MIDIILERIRQGYRTSKFPNQPPSLSERYQGKPEVDFSKCEKNCEQCSIVCPTSCISVSQQVISSLDIGSCVFCGKCANVCPNKAISFTMNYEMAYRKRDSMILKKSKSEETDTNNNVTKKNLDSLFRKSLKLRQVSVGGCNACEADINVLQTLTWDFSRFGLQIVASPRHADGIIVTGPVTKNMKVALLKTYDALSNPKIVIAVGTCAISGGIYKKSKECLDGLGSILPVDCYIPGCPPHPSTILDGLIKTMKSLFPI